MMKFMPFLFLLTGFQLWSQSHVDWSVELEHECDVLTVDAKIGEGWHIYSQNQDEEAGPIPTQIIVEVGKNVIRSATEPTPVSSFDENYGGTVLYFENEVTFRTALPVDAKGEMTVKVVYMLCNDEGCLPPEMEEFKLSLKDE